MSSTIPAVKNTFEVDEFAQNQYQVSRGSTQNRKTWQVVYKTKKFGNLCPKPTQIKLRIFVKQEEQSLNIILKTN